MSGTFAALAQLTLPGSAPICGQVKHMNPKLMAIELDPGADSSDCLREGLTGSLVIISDLAISRSSALVVKSVGSDVLLGLSAPLRRDKTRMNARVRCSGPADLRFIRPDGIRGGWTPAELVDISTGGVGVVIDSHCSPSNVAEVVFCLSDSLAVAESGGNVCSDGERSGSVATRLANGDEFARNQIRATGRVAHMTQLTNSNLRMGLAFTYIPPVLQLRIVNFIDSMKQANR